MTKVTKVASYAFTGRDKLRTVRISRNVKKIEPSAFYGCDKLKTLHVKSKKLTKKTVRGSLDGSVIDTVVVMKKASGKYADYKKIFTKKITGASGKLSIVRQK